MCTKQDMVDVMEAELYRDGGLKDQLAEDISTAIDARIGRWLIGGGVVMIFAVAAAWFTLRGDVTSNTERLKNVLTQDQAALLIQRLDQFERTQGETKEAVEKLDDRLRGKGI